MKLSPLKVVFVLGFAAAGGLAQDVIPLYTGVAPGVLEDSYKEKQYFSKTWNTEVVSNITKPSLTVYKPVAGTATEKP